MDYDTALNIAKKRNASFSDLVSYSMGAPTVEPVKRKKGNKFPEFQCHRFPIKGGINKMALIADGISSGRSPMFAALRSRKGSTP